MVYVTLLCCLCTDNKVSATNERIEFADILEADLPAEPSIRSIAETEHKKAMSTSKIHFYETMGATIFSSCCCWTFYVLMLGFFLTENDFSFFWFYFPWLVLFGVPCICILCVAICQLPGEHDDEPTTQDGRHRIDITGIDADSLQQVLRSAELIDRDGAEIGNDQFQIVGDTIIEVDTEYSDIVRNLVARKRQAKQDEESGLFVEENSQESSSTQGGQATEPTDRDQAAAHLSDID